MRSASTPLEDLRHCNGKAAQKIRHLRPTPAGYQGLRLQARRGLEDATLRPYQLEGLSWMQSLRQLDVGGILADATWAWVEPCDPGASA